MSTPVGTVTTQPLNQARINEIHSSIDKTKKMVLNLAAITAGVSNKIQPGTLPQADYDMLQFAFKEVNATLAIHEALLRQIEGLNDSWQTDLQTLQKQVEQLRLNLK